MLFKSLIVVALASVVSAGWEYIPNDLASASISNVKDLKQASSASLALVTRYSNHVASLTTRSDYLQVVSDEAAFMATRTGLPGVLAATDRTRTYTAKPTWYDTLPSGVKNFYEQEFMAASSIIAEVQGEVNKANDAARPKPVAVGLYASGALVAMVAGLAAGL